MQELPSWFSDREIRGKRVVFILKKFGLDPNDHFARMVFIEFMAARERSDTHPIKNSWALFNRLVLMAAKGQPEPLCYSKEGEEIRERLAKQGLLR